MKWSNVPSRAIDNMNQLVHHLSEELE